MSANRIGRVAREAGVSIDTVRFYERRGIIPPPERETSGYRRYAGDTAERIRLVRSLQALGFTLDDVVDAFRSMDAGGATCEGEQWRLEAVLERIDNRLDALHRVRHDLVEALDLSRHGHCVLCGR